MFSCRVVNEPLESISLDLGFGGNTLAEGNNSNDLIRSFLLPSAGPQYVF